MKKLNPFDRALGGEAWRMKPRTMPWDRPPQFAEIDAGLNYMFKQLRHPVRTKQMLNLMKSGMPVDMLAEEALMGGFRNGKFGAPAMLQMVAPTVAMMWRMAESAGVRPMTSADREQEAGPQFDPTELLMAQRTISDSVTNKANRANEMSKSELLDPRLVERPGFMSFRPKLKSGQ